MAEGVHYVFSSDINVSIFNGASPFEEFEEEIEALLRARPELSAQKKKDLVYRNLGRDVRSELSCQQKRQQRRSFSRPWRGSMEIVAPHNTLALEFYGSR